MTKFLVSLAALAVIAYVGYFFWGEYHKALAANAEQFKTACQEGRAHVPMTALARSIRTDEEMLKLKRLSDLCWDTEDGKMKVPSKSDWAGYVYWKEVRSW